MEKHHICCHPFSSWMRPVVPVYRGDIVFDISIFDLRICLCVLYL